jgi:hypothetical protein
MQRYNYANVWFHNVNANAVISKNTKMFVYDQGNGKKYTFELVC